MPDHVIVGRRLKALVNKFRIEAVRNANLARKAAKDKADAAARQKKFLEDMERNKWVKVTVCRPRLGAASSD